MTPTQSLNITKYFPSFLTIMARPFKINADSVPKASMGLLRPIIRRYLVSWDPAAVHARGTIIKSELSLPTRDWSARLSSRAASRYRQRQQLGILTMPFSTSSQPFVDVVVKYINSTTARAGIHWATLRVGQVTYRSFGEIKTKSDGIKVSDRYGSESLPLSYLLPAWTYYTSLWPVPARFH
jgi:hypothetical protein